MFDELLTPPPSVDHPSPEVIAPIDEVVASGLAISTSLPSSTIVYQDAPSPSNSQTTPETQSPILPNDVEEDNHDLDVAHMNNDSFFGITIPENDSKASSSDVIPTVVQTAVPNSEHVTKWTKDHPLDNIIAMQEELHEFDHLEVWELVTRPDKVMLITLKWIYKVKLDEMGGILKNKACLVAHGCCAQVIWMRSQLTDYGLGFNKIPIWQNIFTKALGREIIEFLINKAGNAEFYVGDSKNNWQLEVDE
ncbi:hypothetical protein Tco_1009159 [Tanacetum coccineum]